MGDALSHVDYEVMHYVNPDISWYWRAWVHIVEYKPYPEPGPQPRFGWWFSQTGAHGNRGAIGMAWATIDKLADAMVSLRNEGYKFYTRDEITVRCQTPPPDYPTPAELDKAWLNRARIRVDVSVTALQLNVIRTSLDKVLHAIS
jgi:hypothetical protein